MYYCVLVQLIKLLKLMENIKNMTLKRAAMFGLDARIALAIFGALSVIGGAALFSAIQQARTTKYAVALTEFVKALDAYELDTYTRVSEGSFPGSLNLGNLGQNYDGESGWRGPYITSEPYVITHLELTNISV